MLEILQVTWGVWVKPPSWYGCVPPGSVVRCAVGGSGAGELAAFLQETRPHTVVLPVALSVDWSSSGPSPQGALAGPSCSLAGPVAVPGVAMGDPWFSTDFLSPVSLWSVIGRGQRGWGVTTTFSSENSVTFKGSPI